MIEYLQKTLDPVINEQAFEFLDNQFKPFFDKTYSKFYDCKLCSENCKPEIFTIDGNLFISCDNDILETPYQINSNDAVRYKFSSEKLAQKIASKNNISLNFQKTDCRTFYIGAKNINNLKYDFYFLFDICNLNNSLNDITIQRIKSLKTEGNRLLLITPDNLIIGNQIQEVLKTIPCGIIFLQELLGNDFLIDIQDLNEYDLIVNADTLSIKIWGIDCLLTQAVDTFAYIYNLALTPKDILNVEQARGMKKAYSGDKTLLESTRRMKSRLIDKLKEEFKKQNKPVNPLDELIIPLNKNESYYLNLEKEKVKIIGKLPA